MTKWLVQNGDGIEWRKDQRPPLVFPLPNCTDSQKRRRIFPVFFHPLVTTTVLTRLQVMFGCKTNVTSCLHTPGGIWWCFHLCCLPGSRGYPISHSNTGNRKSWKRDFCGFLFCPMPEPVTWMRLFVVLSFFFNNYFIFPHPDALNKQNWGIYHLCKYSKYNSVLPSGSEQTIKANEERKERDTDMKLLTKPHCNSVRVPGNRSLALMVLPYSSNHYTMKSSFLHGWKMFEGSKQ